MKTMLFVLGVFCSCLFAACAAAQEVLFEDRFEGSVKTDWTWLRGNNANVRFGKGLEIRCEACAENDAPNVLCCKAGFAGKSAVRIETTVGHLTHPSEQFEQCGIFWRRGGAVVFKLVHELVDGKTYIFPGKVPVEADCVQLRMTVSGPDVIAEFRVEGESSYRRVYEGRLDAQTTDEICLQCSGGPSSGEHWVAFRSFIISKSDD